MIRFSSLRLVVGVAAALLLGFVWLAPVGLAQETGQTYNVSMIDFEFDPLTLAIDPGDTVVWTNNGNTVHTVTANDGSFDSGDVAPGESFSYTFENAAEYPYYCRYHGDSGGEGMVGLISVGAAAPGQQTTPTSAAEMTPTSAAEMTPTSAAEMTPTSAAGAITPAVSVEDQAVVNNTVTIGSVTAAQDGWMVIHRDDNGAPGAVIGNAAVMQGENSDVVVTLDEEVSANEQLWAMLHIDAGTAGEYEFPGPDTPVTMDGDIVMQQFTVTSVEGAMDEEMTATPAAGSPTPEPTVAGGAPAQLPTTGGNGGNAALLVVAALLLVIGGGLALAGTRRRS